MPINLDDIKRKYRELKSQPQPQEPRERPKMMPRREPRIEPLEKKPGSPWSSKINRQRSIRREIKRRIGPLKKRPGNIWGPPKTYPKAPGTIGGPPKTYPESPRNIGRPIPKRYPTILPINPKPESPQQRKGLPLRKEIMRRVKKSPKEYPERSKRYYA